MTDLRLLEIDYTNPPTTGDSVIFDGTTFVSGKYSILAYSIAITNYIVLPTDYTIDCITGTFTVLLITAVGRMGQKYEIKNSGTGYITVDPSGAETIDGESTVGLSQYESITIQSNGANWILL